MTTDANAHQQNDWHIRLDNNNGYPTSIHTRSFNDASGATVQQTITVLPKQRKVFAKTQHIENGEVVKTSIKKEAYNTASKNLRPHLGMAHNAIVQDRKDKGLKPQKFWKR